MREKQAQQELQARRQQLENEQRRLVQMQAEEHALREEQREPLGRGEDLHKYASRRHFLEQAIKENVQGQGAQQARIAQATAAVAAQEAVVRQAGIDVKALDKLKDKQREEHRLEQLREEGIFLDDLAGQGFLRRRAQAARLDAERETGS